LNGKGWDEKGKDEMEKEIKDLKDNLIRV